MGCRWKRLGSNGCSSAWSNKAIHTGWSTEAFREKPQRAVARLPAVLDRHQPIMVLIELGANDGLRGQSLKRMRANLEQMVDLSREHGAQVLLFQMMIPPNYGPAYANGFADSFAQVAESSGALLVPFFLAEIALDEANFQLDGIHPTAAAQPRLLDAVWPYIEPGLTPNNDPS